MLDRRPAFRRLGPFSLEYGYAPPYATGVAPEAGDLDDSSSGQREASGSLQLDVEPHTAQIYVDGFYIGSVDDVRRTGVMLPTGRHWIDLRASGYEALTIPMHITAGQPTHYRGDLTAVRASPLGAPPRAAGGTMYVIPGCYAGNRPPRDSALARGCDVARLRVLTEPH
jgi:hypothetical protein